MLLLALTVYNSSTQQINQNTLTEKNVATNYKTKLWPLINK